jgi:D-ribose pyranose/furanose isomerase RbsD
MKKNGILPPGLSRLVAEMGHTDTLCAQASRFDFKIAMIK